MSDIKKYALLIILNCYFLVTISQTNLTKHSIQQNETEIELINQAILDYDFFSYDIIDHRTLLVKFDITHSILYQQSKVLYDAHLYVSKIPTLNYKINIGSFSGLYEKEIDGTIIDHFTFCLVLTLNLQPKKFNLTSNRNKTQTIFHKYLKSSHQKQQQRYIVHYCTKMGPDEDHYRHHKKQGSEGDHVLLLLQVMMIGIFLAGIQIAHIGRNRKHQQSHSPSIDQFCHDHPTASHDGLGLLRFRTIDEEKSQEQEEDEQKEKKEEEGDSLAFSHRQLPSPITKRKRSRSLSSSVDRIEENPDDSSIEHILESKPWLQIPK